MCELIELRHNHLSLEKLISLLMGKQPASLHPSGTPQCSESQTLPARDCRVRFTKAGHSCTCRTLAQIRLREIFSRGTPPLSSGTPKIFFLVLLQGTVCQGNPLSPVQAEQGTSEPEEIHVHHKVLGEKESHHRWMQISNPK